MTLTGHQVEAAKVLALSAAINVLMNLLLIPPLGMEGAAIANASVLAFWNVILVFRVRRLLGIDPTPLGWRAEAPGTRFAAPSTPTPSERESPGPQGGPAGSSATFLRPKVVCIAGYGRSGSTVLDLLLDQAGDTVGVGELVNVFDEWRPSGTGPGTALASPYAAAWDFWQGVRGAIAVLPASSRERRGAGSDDEALLDARRVQDRIERLWTLPLVGLGLMPKGVWQRYTRLQQTVFSRIAGSLGARVVVDSSKTAWRSAARPVALQRCGFDVRVIHLVRDGRGVLWSVLRGDNVRLARGEVTERRPFARLRTVLGWTVANWAVLVSSWFLPTGSVLRVSYEDWVSDPTGELRRIGEFCGVDVSRALVKLERGETVAARYQVAGNRVKLRGVKTIVDDAEWRRTLSRSSRVLYWIVAGFTHFVFCRPKRRAPRR
jgi:hypothetical protein